MPVQECPCRGRPLRWAGTGWAVASRRLAGRPGSREAAAVGRGASDWGAGLRRTVPGPRGGQGCGCRSERPAPPPPRAPPPAAISFIRLPGRDEGSGRWVGARTLSSGADSQRRNPVLKSVYPNKLISLMPGEERGILNRERMPNSESSPPPPPAPPRGDQPLQVPLWAQGLRPPGFVDR